MNTKQLSELVYNRIKENLRWYNACCWYYWKEKR
jgi:hypothetical protein